MTIRIDGDGHGRGSGGNIASFLIVALAGLAVRIPLATAYPVVTLWLFLWIVADTLMLALVARSAGRPAWHGVLAVLAGTSLIVAMGAPPALRRVLLETPTMVGPMVASVLAHVVWAAVRARRVLSGPDASRENRWRSAASTLLPPMLVRLAAAEIMVLHMALFRWSGPADVPADARAFAYHRHLTPMCAALLILSAIEMAVYHLLIGHWSRSGAIVMFVLSDVGFVYLIGLIKSFRFRPVLLMPDGIQVRAGFLIDEIVPFDAIVSVDTDFAGDEVRDASTLNAALLAWPNIMLRLDRPRQRRSFLRGGRRFDRIAFRLDEPASFIRLVRWRLGERTDRV